MKIIAIDPGLTVGISTNILHPNEIQIKFDNIKNLYDTMSVMIAKHNVCVCESFDRRQKEHVFEIALKQIGVIELICTEVNVTLVMQTPTYGKGQFDNKKLKHLGIYKPGESYEHAMDALRHRLQYEDKIGLFDLNSLRGL